MYVQKQAVWKQETTWREIIKDNIIATRDKVEFSILCTYDHCFGSDIRKL